MMRLVFLGTGILVGLGMGDFWTEAEADSFEARPAVVRQVMAETIPSPEDKTCYYTKPAEHDRTYTLAILPGVTCLTILK